MREVAVIGAGMSQWGELWRSSLRDLFVDAALAAVKDAGIGVEKLDSMVVGCMTSGLFTGQEHLGPLMADYLGAKGIPATRVESACASGGLAFRTGVLEVASGASDIVLVGGVEKMTDVSGDQATRALAAASDFAYEAFNGITLGSLVLIVGLCIFPLFLKRIDEKAYARGLWRGLIAAAVFFLSNRLFALATKIGRVHFIVTMLGVIVATAIVVEGVSLAVKEEEERSFRTDVTASITSGLLFGVLVKLAEYAIELLKRKIQT